MQKRIAIVTGASGGFGLEFVKLLNARGDIDEIWAVSRSAARLNKILEELGEKIRAVPLDLSLRESAETLAERLKADGASVRYLVNNAGFAKFCGYDGISAEESLNMIDLNACAVVSLCLECLPFMERGSRIINIASQASFFPLPYMNIYSATKVFVRYYSRALNVELKERGITCCAVCPGWMKTNLYDRGNAGDATTVTRFLHMSDPARVAAKALRDADRGRDISTSGVYVALTRVLSHILPERLTMRLWLNQQRIR